METTIEQLKEQDWYIKDSANITVKEKFLLDCLLEAAGFRFIPSYIDLGYNIDTYTYEAYIGYRYDYGPDQRTARIPFNATYHNVVYAVARRIVDESSYPWLAFAYKEITDLLTEHIKKEASL